MLTPGYIPGFAPGYNQLTITRHRYRSATLCLGSDGPDFRQPEDALTIRIYDFARQQASNAVFPIYDFLAGAPGDNLQAIVNAITPDMLMMGFDLILPPRSDCLQIEQSEGSANLLISITCNNPLLWTEIKLYE